MTQHRVSLETACILHHRPFRDTSLIVDVLSEDHGRLVLVARGARRPRSRQRALLQPFRPLLVSWRKGGEMGTLTAVEAGGNPRALRGQALMAGFYLNELLLRLLPREDPHPGICHIYDHALSELEAGELARPLRCFEKRLLDELGLGLPLSDRCVDGTPLKAEARYLFDPERGAMPAAENTDDKGSVSGHTLLALARERLDNERSLEESRRILSEALLRQLGERPLRTGQVMRALRQRGLVDPRAMGETENTDRNQVSGKEDKK